MPSEPDTVEQCTNCEVELSVNWPHRWRFCEYCYDVYCRQCASEHIWEVDDHGNSIMLCDDCKNSSEQ